MTNHSSKYVNNWPIAIERCHHCFYYGWGNKQPWCRLLKRSIGALGHCASHVLRDISAFNDFEEGKEDPLIPRKD